MHRVRRVGFLAFASAMVASVLVGSAGARRTDATQVTFIYNQPVVQQFIPWLAANQNLFPSNVNVSVNFVSTAAILPLFQNGSAQFLTAGPPYTETATAAGVPMAHLGSWQLKSDIQFVAQPGISSIKDLAGKTIGITQPGSAAALWTNYVLNKAGLSNGDFHLISLWSLSALNAAFISGTVNAFVDAQPNTNKMLSSVSGSKVIFDFFTSDLQWPNGNIDASLPWVKAHPAATVSVLIGIDRALALTRSNPTLTKQLLATFTNDSDPNDIDVAYQAVLKFQKMVVPFPLASEQFIKKQMMLNGLTQVEPILPKTLLNSTYVTAATKQYKKTH